MKIEDLASFTDLDLVIKILTKEERLCIMQKLKEYIRFQDNPQKRKSALFLAKKLVDVHYDPILRKTVEGIIGTDQVKKMIKKEMEKRGINPKDLKDEYGIVECSPLLQKMRGIYNE